MKEWRRWGRLGVGVLIFVALGIAGVADALNLLIGVGVALLVALLLWPESWWRMDVFLVRLVGAALVAFLALAGVNVLIYGVRKLFDLGPLPILVGLILALVVFGLAVYWYLRKDNWSFACSLGWAVALAVGILIVTPYVIGKLAANTDPVPVSERVASKLDVMIVGDGSHHPAPPQIAESPALRGFEVSYSVGFAAGDEVRWTLANGESGEAALAALAKGSELPPLPTPPERRTEADAVLLLLPDGTAPVTAEPAKQKNLEKQQEEVARWGQVAEVAAPGTPTYALLETTDTERLGRWKKFVPGGRAVSLQQLETPAVTDVAAELAINAPTAKADFALAMAYRPILLFDHEEPVPWPLSIAALFNEGRITLCHDQGVAKTECDSEPLAGPQELENNGTHLRLRDSRELRVLARSELKAAEEETEESPSTQVPGAGSTIYVHPVSLVKNERELLYLDYWWYLPDNPVGVGGGALCGAGFVIPGVTCQNHQSDWEGMTVVVDRTEARPRVTAVQYAQHSDVVRYSWTQLRERWDSDADVQGLVAGIPDAASRPLAFSAMGTHATYPLPCGRCHQVAHPDIAEGPRRGDLAWVGDLTSACGKSSCLQLLPTRAGGAEPALWNAYNGPWGERHCFLTYYCDSGSPPTSPGKQGRYERPASYDGYVNKKWEFESKPFEEATLSTSGLQSRQGLSSRWGSAARRRPRCSRASGW